jgi:hypothetical protein
MARKPSALTLFLAPLDGSTGGYVHDEGELDDLIELFTERGTEEWETQIIDSEYTALLSAGKSGLSAGELFALAAGIVPSNEAAIYYLLSEVGNRYDRADDLIEEADDLSIVQGTAEDYAEEMIDDIFQIPKGLRPYIDCAAFGRDLEMGGDIAVFDYDGQSYVVTNPHG